jgi:hypothetical protein
MRKNYIIKKCKENASNSEVVECQMRLENNKINGLEGIRTLGLTIQEFAWRKRGK